MTAESALGFSLGIAITLLLLAAWCVRVLWKRASASTPPTNPPDLSEVRRRLESLEADQVALSSNVEKLCTTAKRLTSRDGMQRLRESRSSPSVPPVGASKADLFRHYGMAGKVGPEFAQAQLDIERRTN
jgi:hypothetical protein